MGLKWKFGNSKQFTFLYDTKLSYGGRRAPGIFHRLTQAVKHMMRCRNFEAIVVYLDDLLVIGPTLEQCTEVFNCLLSLLQQLGFDISWHKVVYPTQHLVFLGVLLDSISQSMSLPEDKLVALQAVIIDFLHQHRASKWQLQSLAGRLNWACLVVYDGRTFLRRILDSMASLTSSSSRYKFTSDFYADLLWWHHFLVVFNGTCLFLDSKPLVEVQTDACYEAAGAYFGGDWLYYNFTAESKALVDLHINYKETLAVVMAAERWGQLGPTSMLLSPVITKLLLQSLTKARLATHLSSLFCTGYFGFRLFTIFILLHVMLKVARML